jgi:hypothetical protein
MWILFLNPSSKMSFEKRKKEINGKKEKGIQGIKLFTRR